MCVAAVIHKHNNSGSAAAASAAMLLQRGVLPEVIVLGKEEEEDTKVEKSAEVKQHKGKRRQWGHPDNWKWLETALLLARKIGVHNVVYEVPRLTLSRLHKRLKGQDAIHKNSFSRGAEILS